MAIVRFDPFRTTREFDRLANQFLGLATSDDREPSFAPAYDLEQYGDDTYMIHLALPGVSEHEVELSVHEGTLIIASKTGDAPEKSTSNTENAPRTLYRGIGRGRFERRFRLAEHVEVSEARLANGILSIQLVRQVPEALKPRSIKIVTEPNRTAQDAAPAVQAA